MARTRSEEGSPCQRHDVLLAVTVPFTFQDLVDSDISHKLLHGIVLQVAIAPVHLQGLVTDLRREQSPVKGPGGHGRDRSLVRTQEPSWFLCSGHLIPSLKCGAAARHSQCPPVLLSMPARHPRAPSH